MKHFLFAIVALMPAMLMLAGLALSVLPVLPVKRLWQVFMGLSALAVVCAVITACAGPQFPEFHPWLVTTPIGNALALLVQLLCSVIAAFSARYLDGEPGQRRFIGALAGVLGAVHVLLMADHWLVLITAWALVGMVLQRLLCFYQDRPFALLAAHKKQIADRFADGLLICAAALAWSAVGSGSLSDLWAHIDRHGLSVALQLSAICLVLAAILRTALLPVHGWLTQVMEAPTPVSALLHAGVVNLGGFVLIRFAPLLDHAMPARTILVAFGLGTAVLAGLVMLTRISIKVRLAWSTTAQMGFLVLECGLGLYTLAALHLLGHSLYKAQAFLSASTVVRQTRLHALHGTVEPIPVSLLLAPVVAVPTVLLIQSVVSMTAWPWWWSAVLGLAWAPLLWLPGQPGSARAICLHGGAGLLMVAGLTCAALLAHALPFGLVDTPDHTLGMIALTGMAVLYVLLVILQLRPQALRGWRRWSYAGFYLDESFTRMALQFWPARWIPRALKSASASACPAAAAAAEDVPR
jgi:NAD(P)H-quinone oxidoreductase subunit 5